MGRSELVGEVRQSGQAAGGAERACKAVPPQHAPTLPTPAERHGHSTTHYSWLFSRDGPNKRKRGAWSEIAQALPHVGEGRGPGGEGGLGGCRSSPGLGPTRGFVGSKDPLPAQLQPHTWIGACMHLRMHACKRPPKLTPSCRRPLQRTHKSVWTAGRRMLHPGNYRVGGAGLLSASAA